MWAAFRKDLRLILRDPALVLLSTLVPILVITVISAALLQGNGGPRLSIAVVDEDHGPVASDFKRALADHADVSEMDRQGAVHFVRDLNRGPAAIVFPPTLSQNYRRGRPTDITVLTDPANEANLRAFRILLMVMEKQAAAQADPFAEPMITLKEQSITGNRLSVTAFEQNLPGFAILFVLIAVIFGTSLGLHDERGWGTLPRLLVAPAGFGSILLGKLGARFVAGVLQLLALLVWSRLAYGVSLGSSLVAVVAVACAVVFATVAMGALVGGLTRTRQQVQPLALAVVIVLSGLGGLWWPQAMEPEWMQAVSPALYTTWAMRAMNDLVLRDRGLAAVGPAMLIITLYGLLTMAGGVALFGRRSRPR